MESNYDQVSRVARYLREAREKNLMHYQYDAEKRTVSVIFQPQNSLSEPDTATNWPRRISFLTTAFTKPAQQQGHRAQLETIASNQIITLACDEYAVIRQYCIDYVFQSENPNQYPLSTQNYLFPAPEYMYFYESLAELHTAVWNRKQNFGENDAIYQQGLLSYQGARDNAYALLRRGPQIKINNWLNVIKTATAFIKDNHQENFESFTSSYDQANTFSSERNWARFFFGLAIVGFFAILLSPLGIFASSLTLSIAIGSSLLAVGIFTTFASSYRAVVHGAHAHVTQSLLDAFAPLKTTRPEHLLKSGLFQPPFEAKSAQPPATSENTPLLRQRVGVKE